MFGQVRRCVRHRGKPGKKVVEPGLVLGRVMADIAELGRWRGDSSSSLYPVLAGQIPAGAQASFPSAVCHPSAFLFAYFPFGLSSS